MSYRMQFDIDTELMDRAIPYMKSEKARHIFGLIAFEEWVNRKEGHDRRAQAIKNESFMKEFKPIIIKIVKETQEDNEIKNP